MPRTSAPDQRRHPVAQRPRGAPVAAGDGAGRGARPRAAPEPAAAACSPRSASCRSSRPCTSPTAGRCSSRLRVRRRRGLARPTLAGGGGARAGAGRRDRGAALVPRVARREVGRRRRQRPGSILVASDLQRFTAWEASIRMFARPPRDRLGLPQLPRHRRPVRGHGPQLAPQRVAAVLRGAGDRGRAGRARVRAGRPRSAGARAGLARDRGAGRVPVLRDRGVLQQPVPVHPGLDRRVHDRRHRLAWGRRWPWPLREEVPAGGRPTGDEPTGSCGPGGRAGLPEAPAGA